MKKLHIALALAATVSFVLPAVSLADQPTPAQLAKSAPSTIAAYKKADPGIGRFFKEAAGYVVFPEIGKAGLIVGGGGGTGQVYEKGRVIGIATVSFLTVGLQAGAQGYSEIIFLQDSAAVERFKANKFEFAANVSAVIVKSGSSSSADYRDGVVVFTRPKSGAMVEAAVGTQKFEFTPKGAAAKK